jgi:hypothetical protein
VVSQRVRLGGHLKLQAEFGAGSSGPEQIHGTAIVTDIINSRTKLWYSQSQGAAEGRISGMAVSMHTRSAHGHRHTINHLILSVYLGLTLVWFGLVCFVMRHVSLCTIGMRVCHVGNRARCAIVFMRELRLCRTLLHI